MEVKEELSCENCCPILGDTCSHPLCVNQLDLLRDNLNVIKCTQFEIYRLNKCINSSKTKIKM